MVRNNVKSRNDGRARTKMPRGGNYGIQSGKRQLAEMDDGILDSDSEEDEFANDAGPSRPRAAYDDPDDEDEDEGEEEDIVDDDDEEEEGVGAWAPDDWDDEASDVGSDDGGSGPSDASGSGSEQDEEAYSRDNLRRLQKDLNALPLASVLKAQKALKKANRRQDDEDDGSDDEDELSRAGPSQSKAQKVAEMKARLADLQRSKGRNVSVATASYGEAAQLTDDDEGEDSAPEISGIGQERGGRTVPRGQAPLKRDSKHAPTAMSSKKQVSRNRQVVEVKKVDRRDPRFSTLSTGTSSQPNRPISASTYSFLPSLLTSEFEQLKTAHALAKKAEMTCRLADKPEKTAERERIEKELARVRTRVERMKREEREKAVLSQYNKEERQKREQGKGAWYLKKSEKKDLLLKARFQSLEDEGGKHAVKKALDKKRRKVAAKEKKSRPFAPGQGGEAGGAPRDGAKRRRVG